MRITVDRDLCQGHAMCALEAPEVFALDPKTDDTVRLLTDEPGEDERAAVARAVKYCPNQALSVED